jgi:chromosome segregation ATPase
MSDKSNSKDMDRMPAIKPAQDEVASFRTNRRSEAPKQSHFNGVLVFVIVVMAIMMGIGGFALYEVQLNLDLSNELLAKSQDHIRELENRLSAAGSTSSQRFQSMESQIQTNVSEIDKLWEVSYRTNRPEIEKNTSAIKTLTAKMDQDIRQLSTAMSSVTTGFERFSKEMNDVREELLSDNQEVVTQVSLVRGEIQDQATVLEKNRRDLAALQQRMERVNEDISTFDRYRQQVNADLRELKMLVNTEPAAP